MVMEVPGKRRRLRPKRRWLDSIRNDLSGREMTGLNGGDSYETSTSRKNGKDVEEEVKYNLCRTCPTTTALKTALKFWRSFSPRHAVMPTSSKTRRRDDLTGLTSTVTVSNMSTRTTSLSGWKRVTHNLYYNSPYVCVWLFANCRSQFLLDRFKLSKTESPRKFSDEWLSDGSLAINRDCNYRCHGWSPTTRQTGDNCGYSGDRLSQNG